MNLRQLLARPEVSPLARQFTRFCQQLDPDASAETLLATAWLAECNLSGDTCLELDRFADQALWRDESGNALATGPVCWQQPLRAGFIGTPDDPRMLTQEGRRLYLHRNWRDELRIARTLEQCMRPAEVDSDWLRDRLDQLFAPVPSGKRWWWQKCATAMALTRHLTLITGGPGTGKTTTVTRILALLLEQRPSLRIRLAAPTGKAAARLSESIAAQKRAGIPGMSDTVLQQLPEQALTLHRLLGWSNRSFRYHADNPLACDCLVVDECSMIDQGLMAHLLAALPSDARLILLGDRQQLASVEAGSVFGDLTGRGQTLGLSPQRGASLRPLLGELPEQLIRDDLPRIADHIVELRHSFRFASGGGIGRLATAIGAGRPDPALQLLETENEELDLVALDATAQPPHALQRWMLAAYGPMLEAGEVAEAMQHFEQARVLCALRQGPWGEQAIGEQFRALLVRKGRMHGRNGPAHGLPILILRNDYETGLFNGDTGIFWEHEGELLAWFREGQGYRALAPAQLPAWQPAWTLTVHRSQGSEYNRVLLVLPPQENPVLCRELIYTGITRARRHCTLVCRPALLAEWVKRSADRQSGLSERLGYAPVED